MHEQMVKIIDTRSGVESAPMPHSAAMAQFKAWSNRTLEHKHLVDVETDRFISWIVTR